MIRFFKIFIHAQTFWAFWGKSPMLKKLGELWNFYVAHYKQHLEDNGMW